MREYTDKPTAISVVNFGEAKTAKTFFGLTMKKPMAFFETDSLSVDRALRGYEKFLGRESRIGEFCQEDNIAWLLEDFPMDDTEIYLVRCPFYPPDDYSTELGFYNYILSMNKMILKAIRSPHIESVAIDTGTFFWQMQHNAEFKKIAYDARNNPNRTDGERQRMGQIEYGNPNARMSQIFREAGIYNKNLLFTCHQRPPEYKNQYGDVLRTQSPIDGWAQFEKAATVITHSTMQIIGKFPNPRRQVPKMEMFLTGSSLDSINLNLEYPTWDKLIEYLEEVR